jgi:hypothetical protein
LPEIGARRYRRDPDIVCRRVATEVILVPIRRNVREVGIYRLNEVAGFVWDRLDEPRTAEDLAREIAEVFEVDEATARRDVETLLAKLAGMGGLHEA